MNRKLIAIVPAAGVGKRAGSNTPKQYRNIAGIPMLRRTVLALLEHKSIASVLVAVAPHDTQANSVLQGIPRTVCSPCGGAERANTVASAIAHAIDIGLVSDTDWVLVHDAARPGLDKKSLSRLIKACMENQQGGLLALPVSDTVKRGKLNNGTDIVQASVCRNHLWLAQTPQMFLAGELLNAINGCLKKGLEITDESSAMEHFGYSPLLVNGHRLNFKITWPEDFLLADKVFN